MKTCSTTPIVFNGHNIRLDDGSYTWPSAKISIDRHPWFLSAKRLLETVFPEDKSSLRLVDLGCLEGGFSVEFARLGFQVLGIDVRESNIAACNYVKERTNLPNLAFVKDDAWKLPKYGTFDAVFCCGLLYHFDRPKAFLEMLAQVTRKVIMVKTHFAPSGSSIQSLLPRHLRLLLGPLWQRFGNPTIGKYLLSAPSSNEGLPGRWYTEFVNESEFTDREKSRWSSWENRRSFWVQREYLIQAIRDVGFDLVLEQFDGLGADIAESLTRGYYKQQSHSTFIGIRA